MTGRELPPTPAFADDDGAAHPGLQAVLERFGRDEAGMLEVVTALVGTRVLVPVLAHELAPAPPGPTAGERPAGASVVAVAAPDGRTALPVFTSVGSLAAWRPQVRPMPVPVPRAAAAAIAQGWDLLVVDPAGPVTVVVPRPAVRALATGGTWEPAVREGAVRGQVRAAVVRAVSGVQAVVTADAVPGKGAEVAVLLSVRAGLTREALDAVVADVGTRLAADAEVTAAVDSLELRVSDGGR